MGPKLVMRDEDVEDVFVLALALVSTELTKSTDCADVPNDLP
jgi:hypothetical protein